MSLLPECPGKTYRGIGKVTSVTVLKAIKMGLVWTWAAFSSTSVAPAAADKFSKGSSFTFTIHGLTGRDISGFSQFPGEKEVLFVPGTMMRVLEITDAECVLQEQLISDVQLAGPAPIDRIAPARKVD
eukprot:TRINITY_DN5444_c0_g2_i1.p1 TRINITY_DN5444_c0_g2~~TRINITY_DN5444_c0_g2_i1.p1  ORF type:complete len:128 (-),score=18.93 TRINITY_DN5444_c0_g2_i1:218-601(-)